MFIAIDFDGTVCTHRYPKIGTDIGAISVLKEIMANGHKIILYTMRCDAILKEAVNWLKSKGIELYGINENPSQWVWTHSPKPFAHLYIDDSALGIPYKLDEQGIRYVDWERVRELLKERNVI